MSHGFQPVRVERGDGVSLKYSFMSFSCPELGLSDMLVLARRLGYDGIEPRIDAKHRHGVELSTTAAQRKAIRALAADHGVAICCVATSCKYADPQTAAGAVESARAAIDLAADIGAPTIRVFGGDLGTGLRRYQAIHGVADSLRSVAEYARDRGVTVCMETHDSWCDPAHVAAVMRLVDHTAIGVNWDYWHTERVAGATADESFGLLKPWIHHVHFHDGTHASDRLEHRAIGSGELEVGRVVALLQGVGYADYLSGEWIDWEPAEVHLPRELRAVKALER